MSRRQNRPKTGSVDTRFKPGVSGNPGGRPKSERRLLAELYGEDGRALYLRLEALHNHAKTPVKLKVEIIEFLIERFHGRAQQRVEVEGGASLVELIAAATVRKAT